MSTATGVRKINENVLQEKRALIITDNDKDNYVFSDLPDGTIYVNTETGLTSKKLKDQSDWIPDNIKQDNTICIIKDSMLVKEIYTIKSIDTTNNTFVYTDGNGSDHTGNRPAFNSFIFDLGKDLSGVQHTYIPGRNHITVMVDGVLLRSTANNEIDEINTTRFGLNEQLIVGQTVDVEYIQWIRVGNPYPRFFMSTNANAPDTAEVGDFWLVTDKDIDDNTLIEEANENNTTINWSLITGTPTSLAGYGIVDKVSMQGHTHKMADITDFTGDTGGLSGYQVGLAAGNIPVISSNGKLSPSIIPDHTHTIDQIVGLRSALNDMFKKGMIMDWYGEASVVPSGWAICDGTNGTPDLRDMFIVGAGKTYTFKATGGQATHTLTANEIPPHFHEGDQPFEYAGYDVSNDNTTSDHGWSRGLGLDVGDNPPYQGKEFKFVTKSVGGGAAHENRPPYYALYKIMRIS